MKPLRLTLFAVFLFFTLIPIKAGENDWHVYIAPSYYLNPLARHPLQGGQIGFEKELSRRRLTGFSVIFREKELFTQASFAKAEYSLLGYYKPALYLGKNDNLYLSFGANIGSGRIGFTYGANIGLEYAITFRNRIKLYFSQDNLLTFRSDDLLISGISIGLKIPLSR